MFVTEGDLLLTGVVCYCEKILVPLLQGIDLFTNTLNAVYMVNLPLVPIGIVSHTIYFNGLTDTSKI